MHKITLLQIIKNFSEGIQFVTSWSLFGGPVLHRLLTTQNDLKVGFFQPPIDLLVGYLLHFALIDKFWPRF